MTQIEDILVGTDGPETDSLRSSGLAGVEMAQLTEEQKRHKELSDYIAAGQVVGRPLGDVVEIDHGVVNGWWA